MIKNNFDDVYYPENLDEILYKNVDEKMVDHIRRSIVGHESDLAMTYMGEGVTNIVFEKKVVEYAQALRSYGISKGDTITLAMPNVPETVYYFYACNEIGATPYLIDPRYTFKNMVDSINNSKSKLFICEMGTYYEKVAKNLDMLPTQNVVVVSPVYMFEGRNDVNSKALVARYLYAFKQFMGELKVKEKYSSREYLQSEFLNLGSHYSGELSSNYDPDIPAIIVNTSGTTGSAIKGAMHSNRSYNVYTNQAPLVSKHIKRGYTYFGYIPYFSMYGSCVGMHTALSHGIIINNIPKFKGKRSLKEIPKSEPNILIGTPYLYAQLSKLYVQKDLDASYGKLWVIGGDNISPEKLKEENESFSKQGMKSRLIFGYGATELRPVTTMTDDDASYVYGSCGIPYPGVKIKIIDPDTMQELDYGNEGEIFVHNIDMMMGYQNMPEETASLFLNIDGLDFFRTGDKGYMDETGHLFFTGRYKRLMKRPIDCHQVTPIPIENVISKSSLVEDCAVVGIERTNGLPGVIPTAFVVLKEKQQLLKEGKIDLAIQRISEEVLESITGERDVALAYVVVDKIPQTEMGKVDFHALESNVFDNLEFYAIDDSLTREYFAGMPNLKVIKPNRGVNRALKR